MEMVKVKILYRHEKIFIEVINLNSIRTRLFCFAFFPSSSSSYSYSALNANRCGISNIVFLVLRSVACAPVMRTCSHKIVFIVRVNNSEKKL